jgi:phosphatidate cytidylyltransferase
LAHALPDRAARVPSDKWSDLWVRFVSAAILGPVALLALWYGGIAWALLVGMGMAGLGQEWTRLAGRPKNVAIPGLLSCIWLVALTLGMAPAFAGLAVVTLLVAWRLGPFAGAGLPYAGIGGLSLVWLRLQAANGLADTLFVVAVIWGTDIGAYVVGRIFGGKKLAPRISPGKTWSGSVGGLLIGALAGTGLVLWLDGHAMVAVIAALALSLFAQGGDLLESAIKRHLGVKDSGDTIPGHGGLFDRLDGFLAAAPLAAIFALIAQGGVPLWR